MTKIKSPCLKLKAFYSRFNGGDQKKQKSFHRKMRYILVGMLVNFNHNKKGRKPDEQISMRAG